LTLARENGNEVITNKMDIIVIDRATPLLIGFLPKATARKCGCDQHKSKFVHG
jgi:hypothetical protein